MRSFCCFHLPNLTNFPFGFSCNDIIKHSPTSYYVNGLCFRQLFFLLHISSSFSLLIYYTGIFTPSFFFLPRPSSYLLPPSLPLFLSCSCPSSMKDGQESTFFPLLSSITSHVRVNSRKRTVFSTEGEETSPNVGHIGTYLGAGTQYVVRTTVHTESCSYFLSWFDTSTLNGSTHREPLLVETDVSWVGRSILPPPPRLLVCVCVCQHQYDDEAAVGLKANVW